MTLPSSLHDYLASQLDSLITGVNSLGGGCIHHAHRLETTGGSFFLKYNDKSHAHNFEMEVLGLSALSDTQTFRIPQVVVNGTFEEFAFLLMEYIEPGNRGNNFWEDMGIRLAKLHQHTCSDFGWEQDNYIGSLSQQNTSHARWSDFFIEERIKPQLRRAIHAGRMDKHVHSRFDKLFKQIDSLFPNEPPAFIHGDLWGGNLLVDTNGSPVLIDPAVYYGHREMELAFMTLFDSQPPQFYAAYESIYPLDSGWKDRVDICNLYPLLVHVNLFGYGYIESVLQILRRFA